MNYLAQIKFSPELPLRIQIIFSEFMPFWKRVIRISIVMRTYKKQIFVSKGEKVLDFDDPWELSIVSRNVVSRMLVLASQAPTWQLTTSDCTKKICAFWQEENQKELSVWLKAELSGQSLDEWEPFWFYWWLTEKFVQVDPVWWELQTHWPTWPAWTIRFIWSISVSYSMIFNLMTENTLRHHNTKQ